jgi:hypothetical protein
VSAFELLRKSKEWGPLLFGIGFIAPLIAQSLDAAGAPTLLGLSHLQLGLAIGIVSGAVATRRGSWV